MSEQELKNLASKGLLKEEPYSKAEFEKLKKLAATQLKDGQNKSISAESRSTLTYDACHSLALAALRYRGYRSEKRYLVFQALVHTLGFDADKVRVLSKGHDRRNLALYEGDSEVDERLLAEVTETAKVLASAIANLPVKDN